MRNMKSLSTALVAIAHLGCAAGTGGELGVGNAPGTLLAAVNTDEGVHLGFYEVEEGDLAVTVELPDDDTLRIADIVPDYQEMSVLELYEAFAEEPAPLELVEAQARQDALRGTLPEMSPDAEIAEGDPADDQPKTIREAFRQNTCFPLSTIDRCLLDQTQTGNRTLYTERGDRIEFWTGAVSGNLTMEIRRSNFLGTFYSRVATAFVPSTGCVRFGLIRSFAAQRNLRARVINAAAGTDYHAAIHITP